jgi:hypothetical protein
MRLGFRVGRSALRSIVCLAAALACTSPAYATPLPSDVPASGSVASHSQTGSGTIGISLWNYVHPGSTDQNEMTIDAQTCAATVSDSPSWVAGPADEQRLDQSDDSADGSAVFAGGLGLGLRLFSQSGNPRSLRYSSGGARSSRITSEPQSVSAVSRATYTDGSVARFSSDDPEHTLLSDTTRLFRPPRV